MPSASNHPDEARSLTPDPNQSGTRTPRRSHVSISSNKRPSMNTGAGNGKQSKQGMFRRAVPQMPRLLAFVCFVLNLILPGTGKKTHTPSGLGSARWRWISRRLKKILFSLAAWWKKASSASLSPLNYSHKGISFPALSSFSPQHAFATDSTDTRRASRLVIAFNRGDCLLLFFA